jgi:hypothetical protein
MPEELFIEKLPMTMNELQEKKTYKTLLARKDILEITQEKITEITLTKKGESIARKKLNEELIEQ